MVAATVLSPPFTGMAKQMGMRELADLRKLDVEYSGTAIAGISSYIKGHPAIVENLLKGYIESLHFFRTQKERTISSIMNYLKMKERARAEEGYDYYIELMPSIPYASANGVKTVLQSLAHQQPKAVNANPEDFYDMSFLKKIEASGFLKLLGARRQ